ncbi:MAG TPA: hypothetical protein VN025_19010 [Candidatus Dormibacteraeota bacterium]|jgi:hypothetical protein|nr:hypothetical protein [Candidatus Dormibacteraeota bacterium]
MFQKSLLIFTSATLFIGVPAATVVRAQSDTKSVVPPDGAALFADLDTSLDSKKAKADDQVVLHTTEALKIQGKIVLPKGTKILGHVTQAQARGKGEAESFLAIQFEKAVPKKGEEIPIRFAIRAIAPARQNSPASDALGQDPMTGTRTATTTSPMGGGRTSTPPGPAVGNPGSAGNSTKPDSGLGNDGQLTPESRGVYGMNGVRLAAGLSKTIPVSVVSSTGKNMRLDSGTRMLLVSIAEVPADPKQ